MFATLVRPLKGVILDVVLDFAAVLVLAVEVFTAATDFAEVSFTGFTVRAGFFSSYKQSGLKPPQLWRFSLLFSAFFTLS